MDLEDLFLTAKQAKLFVRQLKTILKRFHKQSKGLVQSVTWISWGKKNQKKLGPKRANFNP